jgi:multimeric flavodoxin WrbA
MDTHVLGISGSPRREGTHELVRSALVGAEGVEGTTVEYVSLAGKAISPCNDCTPCIEAGHCVIEDDMQPLYEVLLRADAIILGSPVYFGSPSSLLKALMERVEGYGMKEKPLRLVVGGAIATGGSRNGGQETTMLAINLWFHINDMLPVGITGPVTQWGVSGNSGFPSGQIREDRWRLTNNGREVSSIQTAWMYGRKIATVAKMVKAGREATGLDVPDGPYGWDLPDEPPPELEHEALDARFG